ncbi:MAG TPA: hypothetical protein VGC96_12120 [Candidatus Elarobacter sp.]|jgi:hypothetical protein
MSEPPRRRRSTQPPSRPPSQSSSVLPTIALGIGVVVAGLGIGAFLSAVQHKDQTTTSTRTTARSAPVVTPVPRATRNALAQITPLPHPTPTPTPQPTATPQTTPTPNRTASPQPAATPTPAPAATPAERVTPRPAATRAPATPGAVTPRPATPRPATPRPAAPTAVARATPPPPGFSGVAQTTVRRYLSSLIAGNESGAYAELGRAPGEPGANLSEEAFIDRGTRITSMRTTSTDANGATVEVELTSSRGSYFATYHVTNGPGGPVIDQHDYIKV